MIVIDRMQYWKKDVDTDQWGTKENQEIESH